MAKVKCKHCGVSNEKEEMHLSARRSNSGKEYREYYHPECLSLKESREQAIKLFYEYTGSLEPMKMINVAFKQMKDLNVNEHEILYTMEYIIKKKCVLNFAMGIKFYANAAVKECRARQSFIKNQRTDQQKISSIGIVTERDSIVREKITREDDLDISSFL